MLASQGCGSKSNLLHTGLLPTGLFHTGLLLVGIGMVALLCPSRAAAQQEGYEEWLEEQKQEYKQFLSEQDKAFLTFLKKDWTSVRVDTAARVPIDNKPRQIPRVSPSESPSDPREPSVPTQDSVAEPPSDPRPQQSSPESDSFPQGGEMRSPDDMEEAMDQLDKATDEQPPQPETPPPSEPEETPPSEPPPSEQASEKRSSEENPSDQEPSEQQSSDQQPSEQQASETAASEAPGSETQTSDRSSSGPPAPEEAPEAAPLNREASLSFFGASATVPYGAALAERLESAPSKSSIRRFWKKMAEGPYRPTLEVLQKQREDMEMSDWAYYLYLKKLGSRLYGEEAANDRVLWTWFMLMKSGYAARVGYHGSEVLLMLPIDQKIFDRPQLRIDGQRYYLMVEKISGSLSTYEGQHEEASQALQLGDKTLPGAAEKSATRAVEFSFQDERYSFDIAYNPSTVEYLKAYPNVDLSVLFGSGMSSEARASFEETLRPLLQDRPPRESLNLLLKFAQFATDYKRDQEHFGEERYLFPEESLATEYSDCEDRAVLLAYLTRTLLGREVVGLQWPSHVALAVRAENGLTATSEDHTVTVDGETYIYADPTYIGSSVGMKLPLVEGQAPEIVVPGG